MPSPAPARLIEMIASTVGELELALRRGRTHADSTAPHGDPTDAELARSEARRWGELLGADFESAAGIARFCRFQALVSTFAVLVERSKRVPSVKRHDVRVPSELDEHATLPGRLQTSLPTWDERISARDLARLLDWVDKRHRPWDARAHLFELLLAAHDSGERRRRGVYHTPAPLVSYLVRSVDQLLRREFGIEAGLRGLDASHGSTEGRTLRLIDPACGTGTFLAAVAEHLAVDRRPLDGAADGATTDDERADGGRTTDRKGSSMLGFEVMPESCAIARWLVADRSDPRPSSGWHSPCHDGVGPRIERASALESRAVCERFLFGASGDSSDRPQQPPIAIVLGNPPYANFGRQNHVPWVRQLLRDYGGQLRERKSNLADDFVKFIRWAQYWIDRVGQGIVALVTNNSFLDGLTHRGMRQSLRESFHELYLLDLGGDATRRTGSARDDENVFGIRQGVVLSLFIKRAWSSNGMHRAGHPSEDLGVVRYLRLSGDREGKFEFLNQHDVGSTAWTEIAPDPQTQLFVPHVRRCPRYARWPSLTDIFPRYISGVQTKNDAALVAMTPGELESQVRELLESQRGPGQDTEYKPDHVRPYLVAPMDERWIYYDPQLVGRPRWSLMRHMIDVPDNVGLVFMRQSTHGREYDHFLAVRQLISDRVFHSGDGAPFLAPLFLAEDATVTPNVCEEYARMIGDRIGRCWSPAWSTVAWPPVDGWADRQDADPAGDTFGPWDALGFVYATVHRPSYRRRYVEELNRGFPRIPPPESRREFDRLSAIGRRLIGLHLLDPETTEPAAIGALTGKPRIPGRVSNGSAEPRPRSLDAVRATIDAATWETRIGGCQVLPRWIKQRAHREWTYADLRRLHGIAAILWATRTIVSELE